MDVQGVLDCEVHCSPTDPWFEWEGGRGRDHTDWALYPELHPEMQAAGTIQFSFGGFLVRGGPVGDRVVLIDCGNGPDGDSFIPPGHLLDSLHGASVAPEDVTDVLLTHLHYDHTGWLSSRDGSNRPTFPNATVHVHESDVTYFTSADTPGQSARVTAQRLRTVESRLKLFADDGVIVPGINAVAAPGHTPGSTVFVASDGTQRVVFLGDTVHCPVQLVDAEWAVLGDVDPSLASQTRQSLERELDGAQVAGAHFPGLRLGRLVETSVNRQWFVRS
jgi:glyoxylase-like metal-dependent hydrolase (beta-lactamase superfamily II)